MARNALSLSIQNHGYVPEPVLPEHYVQGGYSKLEQGARLGSKAWARVLPDAEIQRRGAFDSKNCTGYATAAAIRILMRAQYGEDFNPSERVIAILAGTNEHGNGLHRVAETVRKQGLAPEELLPFTDDITSFKKYYAAPPKESILRALAEWRAKWRFGHEWVFVMGSLEEKAERMCAALETSPIVVSCLAWIEKNGLYIKKPGTPDTHVAVVYGYEPGQYWEVLDSYDNTHKRLAWDYDFGQAKRYTLDRNVGPAPAPRFGFLSFIKQFIHI